MESIFGDNNARRIQKKESVSFFVRQEGFHLVSVSARAKGEKQLGGTDDEDLKVQIDDRTFPQASFSGGQLHNRKKNIYLLLPLKSGEHTISLNIHGGLTYFRWLFQIYEGHPDQIEKTLAAWNWGMGNFPKTGPLNWNKVPNETRKFINFILQK